MTRLILDTTFLIDRERARAELDAVIDDDDDVAIAAITVAELRVGVLLADRRRRATRAAYVDDVLSTIPVLGYDSAVAEVHAALLAEVRALGEPRGAHELIIAATARSSGRTLVTADRAAYRGLGDIDVRTHR